MAPLLPSAFQTWVAGGLVPLSAVTIAMGGWGGGGKQAGRLSLSSAWVPTCSAVGSSAGALCGWGSFSSPRCGASCGQCVHVFRRRIPVEVTTWKNHTVKFTLGPVRCL